MASTGLRGRRSAACSPAPSASLGHTRRTGCTAAPHHPDAAIKRASGGRALFIERHTGAAGGRHRPRQSRLGGCSDRRFSVRFAKTASNGGERIRYSMGLKYVLLPPLGRCVKRWSAALDALPMSGLSPPLPFYPASSQKSNSFPPKYPLRPPAPGSARGSLHPEAGLTN